MENLRDDPRVDEVMTLMGLPEDIDPLEAVLIVAGALHMKDEGLKYDKLSDKLRQSDNPRVIAIAEMYGWLSLSSILAADMVQRITTDPDFNKEAEDEESSQKED